VIALLPNQYLEGIRVFMEDCSQAHLRELLQTKIDSQEKALTLQAKEYERRLADLNHEAQRLRTMQETYVPREVYEVHIKEINQKIDLVQKMVFVGFGVILAIEFYFKYLVSKS